MFCHVWEFFLKVDIMYALSHVRTSICRRKELSRILIFVLALQKSLTHRSNEVIVEKIILWSGIYAHRYIL